MKKIACLLAAICCGFGKAAIADEFQKVQCGSDVLKAVIGQRSPNGRTMVIEDRYRSLGLKHLGADMISDRLSSVSWLICGAEYMLLVDDRVRDAIPFPPHSKSSPAFSGTCRAMGKDLRDVIFVGVLENSPGTDLLPAKHAWKIDQKRAKFVEAGIAGLACFRSGIWTVDGGL